MALKSKLAELRTAKLARRGSSALSLPASVGGAASAESARSTGRQIASISLYAPDRARIRAIQRAVEDAGSAERMDASKAIRLALRAVEINGPALLAALQLMRTDDGRRHTR